MVFYAATADAAWVAWSVEVSDLVIASSDLPAALTPRNTSTRPPIAESCAWIGTQACEPGRARARLAASSRLAELSEQAYVTVQVVPYSAGAHIGLQGGFAIADLPDLPGIVFLDSVADGQTVEDAAIVSQVTQRFDALRAEALPRGASRDMIRKVAEERWT